jgi:hypothetical protein
VSKCGRDIENETEVQGCNPLAISLLLLAIRFGLQRLSHCGAALGIGQSTLVKSALLSMAAAPRFAVVDCEDAPKWNGSWVLWKEALGRAGDEWMHCHVAKGATLPEDVYNLYVSWNMLKVLERVVEGCVHHEEEAAESQMMLEKRRGSTTCLFLSFSIISSSCSSIFA